MSRIVGAAANLGLAAASIAAVCAVAELFFRFVLPASDYPAVAYASEVIRYRPNQQGVYRMRAEIAAPFRINAQGWNANRPSYAIDKPAGALRVAIIGDSFVEAFQVPVDASLAEQLESLPGKARLQVYRFGISGAPFSQYLWMLEREVLQYRPDAVVLNLVHNDFDESIEPAPGRYSRAFMTLALAGDTVVGVRPPEPAGPGFGDLLLHSAALRYLRFNRQVTPGAVLDSLGLGRAEGPRPKAPPAAGADPAPGTAPPVPAPAVDANVAIARVMEHPRRIESAIDYLVARAAAARRANGLRLLLLMDGARQAIYEGRDSPALLLNRMVGEAAARHGVDFVDLHPLFAAAWKRDRQRFDHPHDGHWNARGHAVAAAAIRAWLDAQ